MKKLFALLLIAVFSVTLAACEVDQPAVGLLPELQDAADGLTLAAAEVTTDIVLPSVVDGVAVVWHSSHPDIINSNGQVFRPSYTRGDVQVTLTAFLLLDGQITSKSFTVNVPKLPESDLEKIAQAVDSLGALLEDDLYNENVPLPTQLHGVTVEWSSTNDTYFSETGHVLRPHFDDGDAHVILTAELSVGAQYRIFKKTLTVEAMPFKQYGLMVGNEGAPLTFNISVENGHELYIPYGNVNQDEMVVQSPYPYVYTPAFDGDATPQFVNNLGVVVGQDWGVAYVVQEGLITEIYDGIGKKLFNAENPEGGSLPEPTYAENITIPEDGFVIIFHNSGAAMGNTLNGREFARNVVGVNAATLGKPMHLHGLELDDIGVKFLGGVFWRGFVEITVPFTYINVAPYRMLNFDDEVWTTNLDFIFSLTLTSDEEAPAADGSNVTGAYPLLFNAAWFDTYSAFTAVDTRQGWIIASVMRPEAEATQMITWMQEEREIILSNEYEVTRVFDGISPALRQKGMANQTMVAAESGHNMYFERDGFLAYWSNNGVGYGDDIHNRRIGADYFLAPENWVWKPTGTSVLHPAGYIKIDSPDVVGDMEFVD
ncbi:MAG: hypothetical protein EA375_02455 [Acholeplasmataceae bacterium]|nr:MAG: hypothetical protein EA375_02455 [Acholeplasmataceae bacterium]